MEGSLVRSTYSTLKLISSCMDCSIDIDLGQRSIGGVLYVCTEACILEWESGELGEWTEAWSGFFLYQPGGLSQGVRWLMWCIQVDSQVPWIRTEPWYRQVKIMFFTKAWILPPGGANRSTKNLQWRRWVSLDYLDYWTEKNLLHHSILGVLRMSLKFDDLEVFNFFFSTDFTFCLVLTFFCLIVAWMFGDIKNGFMCSFTIGVESTIFCNSCLPT